MKDKKIPVKIYIMLASAIICILIAWGIVYKVIKNHSFVVAYAKDEYLVENEEKLLFLNAPESYLPYYNLGNVSYNQKDYNSAIGYYAKALTLYPLGQKECDIRINLALSMCNTIDFQNLSSQEKVDTALIILYKARDILLENGWAAENPEEAKDADAQQLKEDIDRIIEQLENPDNSEDNDEQNEEQDQDQESDSDDQNKSQSEREKRQKDQLEQKKKDAMGERKQEQSELEKRGKSSSGNENDDGDGMAEGDGGSYSPW